MKLRPTIWTTRQIAADRNGPGAAVANGAPTSAADAQGRPHLTLLQTRLWNHTLVLKGTLDDLSAPELQDELECLREEGVTALTLDLRELEAMAPSAAQIIVSQGARFNVQGRHFGVLADAPRLRGTLNEAGGTDLVAPDASEILGRRFGRAPAERSHPDLSTTMTREWGMA
jgi:anti-anti-sigma regulatory factor